LVEMIDKVAEVFRRLGYSKDQISDDQGFLKGVIKFFSVVIKDILA